MRIGLTGGIGCGTSTVARYLQTKGITVISADEVGRQVLRSADVKDALIGRFGPAIRTSTGEIDRNILGQIIFSNAQARQDLDRIVHPPLLAELKQETERIEGAEGTLIIDAALLFEWGLQNFFHKTIVVAAPLETRIARIMQRSQLSRDQVEQRIAAQMPLEEKCKISDFVIHNDGSLDELYERVDSIWKKIIP